MHVQLTHESYKVIPYSQKFYKIGYLCITIRSKVLTWSEYVVVKRFTVRI